MIRAQKRDKHNRNQTHCLKTVCFCRLAQPEHQGSKSEKPDQQKMFYISSGN